MLPLNSATAGLPHHTVTRHSLNAKDLLVTAAMPLSINKGESKVLCWQIHPLCEVTDAIVTTCRHNKAALTSTYAGTFSNTACIPVRSP